MKYQVVSIDGDQRTNTWAGDVNLGHINGICSMKDITQGKK